MPLINGRVSIITRTKNRPRLLGRAFASVLAQTYADWEMIVVNDGGNAAEVEEAASAVLSEQRISIVHLKDGAGMEAASNYGLARTRGEFVAIHDDDDAWHPNFLERLVSLLGQPFAGDFAAAACNHVIVEERFDGNATVELARRMGERISGRIDYSSLFEKNRFPPIALLFRRSCIEQIGKFKDTMPVLGDWEFNIRLMQAGDIAVVDDALAYYHLRVDAMNNAYDNTVTAGQSLHQEEVVKYRNEMIRCFLNKRPENAALFHFLAGEMTRIEHSQGNLAEYTVRQIATEVWFERQRWGLMPKVRKMLAASVTRFREWRREMPRTIASRELPRV